MENHHHHDQHHPGHEPDEAALAELLDLDAEVLHSYLSGVIDWVGELAGGQPRRILDLGTGTGTGALALARRFEGADVIAVDVSAPMLDRLRAKARELGMAGRIQAVQADLDTEWPATGPVDLVWASNSLHHMKDPDQVLAWVFAALRPGGLLAVAELDSFPRFLPDDIGAGTRSTLACRPGRGAGRRATASALRLGAAAECGRFHHRGPAHLRHRPGGPASRRWPAVTPRPP